MRSRSPRATRRRALLAFGAIPGFGAFSQSGCLATGRLNRITPAEPWSVVEEFDTPLLREQWWTIDPALPAISMTSGALTLTSTPASTAFIRAQFLGRTTRERGWDSHERLEWRSTVERAGTYVILFDGMFGQMPFSLQVTAYGFHIMSAPEGQTLRGFEVHRAPEWQTRHHLWQIERTQRHVRLRVDGEALWSGEVAGVLSAASFGETTVDPLHGGQITLNAVRWGKWPLPNAAARAKDRAES